MNVFWVGRGGGGLFRMHNTRTTTENISLAYLKADGLSGSHPEKHVEVGVASTLRQHDVTRPMLRQHDVTR